MVSTKLSGEIGFNWCLQEDKQDFTFPLHKINLARLAKGCVQLKMEVGSMFINRNEFYLCVSLVFSNIC